MSKEKFRKHLAPGLTQLQMLRAMKTTPKDLDEAWSRLVEAGKTEFVGALANGLRSKKRQKRTQSFPKGYHLRDIPRGVFGETSKIREELEELEDSMEQGIRIMALTEASDLLGALRGLLEKHFPGVTLNDLEKMADATRRAFESGARK